METQKSTKIIMEIFWAQFLTFLYVLIRCVLNKQTNCCTSVTSARCPMARPPRWIFTSAPWSTGAGPAGSKTSSLLDKWTWASHLLSSLTRRPWSAFSAPSRSAQAFRHRSFYLSIKIGEKNNPPTITTPLWAELITNATVPVMTTIRPAHYQK